MHSVSLRSLLYALIFPRGFWETTSCSSPYSALSLVLQRIHALRQSTELLLKLTYSCCSHSHCVQRQVPWLWGAERCSVFALGVQDFGMSWGDDFWYSFLTLRFLGRQWIHVGFSLRGFRKNFTRFLREGVQFLVRFLSCPLLCTTCAGWSRQCRIAWRCRRCSSCAVVDVTVFMQRQVPGSPGTGFRSAHRQVRDGLNGLFASFLRHFSPSVQLDVGASVAGTPGACSQAFCHPNSVHS